MPVAVKDCHAMTTYYMRLYKEKYGRAGTVNRNKARWWWEGILMDLSVDEAKELLQYYFETKNNVAHSLDYFANNYEKYIEALHSKKEDDARRAKLREESAVRAREWRERGNLGITSN